ncbi:MAG: hypothetical protein U5K75_00275 [Ahrensia sp.]|nr:hypothetical protein [Ahrensia sp.]
MPVSGHAYRVVGMFDDGSYCVQVTDGVTNGAINEFGFDLGEALFFSKRILAGDMGAARRPGMSRMLAAAVIALTKAGLVGGVLRETYAADDDAKADDDGENDQQRGAVMGWIKMSK